MNRKCDKATTEKITSFFNEIVLVLAYGKDALKVLRTKLNSRVLEILNFTDGQTKKIVFKKVRGGILTQEMDIELPDFSNLEILTKKKSTERELSDLKLAWKLVKIVKFHCYCFCKRRSDGWKGWWADFSSRDNGYSDCSR